MAAMATREMPPALPHGEIEELFPNVFFVTGGIKLPGAMPIRFSRNMVVVREGSDLVIVNSVRLDDEGLAKLDKLGKVKTVIRIAGAHGMDDPFYKERYGAEVMAITGHKYTAGFTGGEPYFKADREIDDSTDLPLSKGKLFVMKAAKPNEGLLVLDQDGGILVSGDALQNWSSTDRFFSLMARPMMRVMGFIKAHNVGPAWLKNTKPSRADLGKVLELPFDNVLPAHGFPVKGGAKDAFRPAIERAMETTTG